MEADEHPGTTLPVAVYDRRLPVPRLKQLFERQHTSIRSQPQPTVQWGRRRHVVPDNSVPSQPLVDAVEVGRANDD